MSRTARQLILGTALLAACAGAVSYSAAAVAPRLAGLGAEPARRALQSLDVTGDGRVAADDAAALEGVAAAARRRLGAAAAAALDPRRAFYPGPAAETPPVLGLVAVGADDFDVARVPDNRLLELAIEARWAAAQARVVAAIGGVTSDAGIAGVLTPRIRGYDPEAMAPGALCAAIEAISVGDLEAGGAPPAAVFDLDSTVWDGNITDGFLASLADQHPARPEANAPLRAFLKTVKGVDPARVDKNDARQNARLLFELATRADLPEEQRVSQKDAFFQIVSLLRDMTPDEARAIGRATFEAGSFAYGPWKARVFAAEDGCGMRRIIAQLQARGIGVYFLSATPDFLAELGGEYLGVPREQVLGSTLEVVDGRYTGKVIDSTYYTKGSICRQWLPAPPLFAFGDSATSDFPMLLETTGAAFMVNPRASLKERDLKDAGGRFVALAFAGIEADHAATAKP